MTTVAKHETAKEYQKSQLVRLADVFFVAPVMIYAGTRKELPPLVRHTLLFLGVATLVYNGKNYLLNERENR